MKKILFVFGTRPETIKMAPVIERVRRTGKRLKSVICVTAQHRHLLDQMLQQFNIKPDIDLNVMKPGQTLGEVTASVLKGITGVYRKVGPDLVLAEGDTTTVYAASLAAYYEGIDVGHIEAGLRSGDIRNPFPEEINRRFVSPLARYNFCPTRSAKKNLLSEGINPGSIFVTGNTVVDALKKTLASVRRDPPVIRKPAASFLRKGFVLITGHRRESFGTGMRNVCRAIESLALKHRDLNWLWTVHLNPNARNVVFKILGGMANVRLVEPPPYREFICLMDRSKFVISDSGGVQEEAPTVGKSVLVTRVCTERPEGIRLGTSILVGTDPKKITGEAEKLLKAPRKPRAPKASNPFGDGMASKRIVDVILRGSCKEF